MEIMEEMTETTETLFCCQCGCEILCDEDIGEIRIRFDRRPRYVGIRSLQDDCEEFEKEEIICADCLAETRRTIERDITAADFNPGPDEGKYQYYGTMKAPAYNGL